MHPTGKLIKIISETLEYAKRKAADGMCGKATEAISNAMYSVGKLEAAEGEKPAGAAMKYVLDTEEAIGKHCRIVSLRSVDKFCAEHWKLRGGGLNGPRRRRR